MNTGNIANWDGSLIDIGPIYPFVGLEWLMVILGLVFWIGWHILQIRAENRQLEDETSQLRQGSKLVQAVEAERIVERL